VTDFDKDGEPSGFSTQCVTEGTACPCGKNTVAWSSAKSGGVDLENIGEFTIFHPENWAIEHVFKPQLFEHLT